MLLAYYYYSRAVHHRPTAFTGCTPHTVAMLAPRGVHTRRTLDARLARSAVTCVLLGTTTTTQHNQRVKLPARLDAMRCNPRVA